LTSKTWIPVLGGFAVAGIINRDSPALFLVGSCIGALVAAWLISALAVALADIAHRLAQLVEIGRSLETQAQTIQKDVECFSGGGERTPTVKELRAHLHNIQCETIHLRVIAEAWAKHAGVKVSDPPPWFGKE
jgi:hypothetical protein